MNLLWAVFLPTFFVLIVGIAAHWTVRLKFFSKKARDLEDVTREFQELRIDEFEKLVCPEADTFVNREWRLSGRLRRQACTNRIKIVHDWLSRIALNAALCVEVARFQIKKAEADTGRPLVDRDHVAIRIFDRAAMCHFMAAFCLGKLYFIELCRIAWPFYLPALAGRFEVRGHSLTAWYGHLVEGVLELADEDERDWLHDNVLFMLTGLVEMP